MIHIDIGIRDVFFRMVFFYLFLLQIPIQSKFFTKEIGFLQVWPIIPMGQEFHFHYQPTDKKPIQVVFFYFLQKQNYTSFEVFLSPFPAFSRPYKTFRIHSFCFFQKKKRKTQINIYFQTKHKFFLINQTANSQYYLYIYLPF